MKNWSLVKIGSLATQIKRTEIVNPTKEYDLLGVRLGGRGAFHRETKIGSSISAKYLYKVEKGDFIYSRLFAWQGAFDVIEEDLMGKYVSNEYPLYKVCSERINVHFLKYWFRLREVLKRVEADCTGSTPQTRNRFKECFFEALAIPLPNIAIQNKIVSRIESIFEKVRLIEKNHSEVDRLSTAFLHSVFSNIIGNVPYKSMADVAPFVRRQVMVNLNDQYNELGIRSYGKGTFHKPLLNGIDVGNKKLYWIEKGDLLFSNVFAWEGAIAIVKPEDHNRVGSHRFISRVPKHGVATANFLKFYFLTNEGLSKIQEASPGGAGRNRTLGLKKLDAIKVPVPKYKIQQEFDKLCKIVSETHNIHDAQKKLIDAFVPSVLDKAFKGESM